MTSFSQKIAWLNLFFIYTLICSHVFVASHVAAHNEDEVAFASVLSNVEGDDENDQVAQPYRTAYHFQPPKNWINGDALINFFILFVRLLYGLI